MAEEQKKEEVKEETPVTEEVTQEEVKVEERPEINWEMEARRKSAELEALRASQVKVEEPKKYDPNDITTWDDNSLRALRKDPQYMRFHDQAEEILMERKAQQIVSKQMEAQKQNSAESQLRKNYPDSFNPASELALKMEQIMQEHDLKRSPAGRLVAAKLAKAELGQTKSSTDVKARKNETDRVKALKGQVVDGDRAKPTQEKSPEEKQKNLKERLLKEGTTGSEAMGDWIDSKNLREKFGKVWGE